MSENIEQRMNNFIDVMHEKEIERTAAMTKLIEVTHTLAKKLDKIVDKVEGHHDRLLFLEQFEGKISDIKSMLRKQDDRMIALENKEQKRATIKTFFLDLLKNWRYFMGMGMGITALYELAKLIPK